MNNPSKSCYYFFSAIESGEQIDVKTKEGREIYLDAEEALKKQIPQNPLYIKAVEFKGSINPSFKSGKCPCCGEYVDSDDNRNFCDKKGCGQALKWDDIP